MNVQFSLSANTSLQPQTQTQSQESSITNNSAVGQEQPSNHNLSLTEKERQGMNVSIGEEQLIRTIEKAVKSLQGPETTLDISIHEKTREIMVKVLNKDTGDVIREVPPERTLDLVASMMEIAGILIDEKV